MPRHLPLNRLPAPRTAALLAAALLVCATAGPAYAADPTIAQIHARAASGDTAGALAMMEPVLKDHPNSAKAHYVEAELLAHAHRLGEARGELAKAEQLAPGLPGVRPQALSQLKAELNGVGITTGTGVATPAPAQPSLPWGAISIIGIAILGFLALMRRRSAPAYPPGGMTGAPGPGYGGMPMGGGMGMGMGGMGMGGGGLMGGLASGLGMGAGLAVGEEVVGHMFGGHQGGFGGGMGGPIGGGEVVDPNANMGGDDFGISDAGSWDDGGGGGAGDW